MFNLPLCFSIWHRVRQRENMVGLGWVWGPQWRFTACSAWAGEEEAGVGEASLESVCLDLLQMRRSRSEPGQQRGLQEPGTQSRDSKEGK